MLIYCAVTSEFKRYIEYLNTLDLPKFNILMSYYYYYNNFDVLAKFSNNILIDSGAFTFQKTGLNQIKEYTNNYIKFIKKHTKNPKVHGFVELDIDNKIGYENVLKIRNELEKHSDKIIPVWHKQLGIKEYKNMVQDYPYVAVSGFANEDIKPDQLIYFVKYAHKHNTKIHGLGLARTKILDYTPFDSVDATSWFKCGRFGNYNGKKVKSEYIRNNRDKLLVIELLDHIKLQYKYYNKYKAYHNDKM